MCIRDSSQNIQVKVGNTVIPPAIIDTAREEDSILHSVSTRCGANRFFFKERVIEFVLNANPACVITLNLIEAVQVSVKLAVPLDEFFKNTPQTEFIDKLSALLDIPTDQLRIVKIDRGAGALDLVMDGDKNDPNPKAKLAQRVNTLAGLASTGQLPIEEMSVMYSNSTKPEEVKPEIIDYVILEEPKPLPTPEPVPKKDEVVYEDDVNYLIDYLLAGAAVTVIVFLILGVLYIIKVRRAKKLNQEIKHKAIGAQSTTVLEMSATQQQVNSQVLLAFSQGEPSSQIFTALNIDNYILRGDCLRFAYLSLSYLVWMSSHLTLLYILESAINRMKQEIKLVTLRQ
eukprot:TRINITY_DN7954_c0_g1_i5.p1 TRINITY_DN7954_c0_g1~~TRINITY_DN7954_c0_g1_i5.p1  ORF type:complete len:343 (+),score=84.50 TRINITY_DN7954_c0_g1_i5:65-1093(+)